MEIKRLFDLLPNYEASFKPKDDVLAGKVNGEWIKYDIKAYREFADHISFGLIQLGIKKGDKIATISNNRPEWNFIDMGIMQTGAIHVPIYPTISEDDYKYILKHAEVKYVFVSGKELLRKIEHLLPEIDNILDIYTISQIDEHKHLNELIEAGKKSKDEKILESIK
ncbi:MAG: long-chain fatty acid--CoA ligase, partial [Marinilabiliales bacterium]